MVGIITTRAKELMNIHRVYGTGWKSHTKTVGRDLDEISPVFAGYLFRVRSLFSLNKLSERKKTTVLYYAVSFK